MSERKLVDDLEKKEVRPRFFLARIISSKRRMLGSAGLVVSRSWINSLKAGERLVQRI